MWKGRWIRRHRQWYTKDITQKVYREIERSNHMGWKGYTFQIHTRAFILDSKIYGTYMYVMEFVTYVYTRV